MFLKRYADGPILRHSRVFSVKRKLLTLEVFDWIDPGLGLDRSQDCLVKGGCYQLVTPRGEMSLVDIIFLLKRVAPCCSTDIADLIGFVEIYKRHGWGFPVFAAGGIFDSKVPWIMRSTGPWIDAGLHLIDMETQVSSQSFFLLRVPS